MTSFVKRPPECEQNKTIFACSVKAALVYGNRILSMIMQKTGSDLSDYVQRPSTDAAPDNSRKLGSRRNLFWKKWITYK